LDRSRIRSIWETHTREWNSLSAVKGYAPYFKEAFGSEQITKERVAQAIADYERTRMSGNSPYDRWRFKHEQNAVPAAEGVFSVTFSWSLLRSARQ
jgi:cytochrome c peroxidase